MFSSSTSSTIYVPAHQCLTCNWTHHSPEMLQLHRTPLSCQAPCIFTTRCLTTYTAHRARSHNASILMQPLPGQQVCPGCRQQFLPDQLEKHTRASSVSSYTCPLERLGCTKFVACTFAALKLHSWEVHAEVLDEPA